MSGRKKRRFAPRDGTITAISPQRRDPDRLSLFVDGVFAAGARRGVVSAAGLAVGDEVTVRQLEALYQEDRDAGLHGRALDLLARRRRSVSEMRTGLRRAGGTDRAVDEVIARLSEAGLLDDASYAEAFADERRRVKRHGPGRVRRDLVARGVASRHIDVAVAAVFGEDDLTPAATALLERRRRVWFREPDEHRRLRRAVAYLVRRGYSYQEARAAWDALPPDPSDED